MPIIVVMSWSMVLNLRGLEIEKSRSGEPSDSPTTGGSPPSPTIGGLPAGGEANISSSTPACAKTLTGSKKVLDTSMAMKNSIKIFINSVDYSLIIHQEGCRWPARRQGPKRS